MRTIYALAGIDASRWQPIDFLSNPLLIHKSKLPNGAADLYDLYYQVAQDLTGRQLTDGHNPQAFTAQCQSREDNLSSLTDKVMNDLLDRQHDLTDAESAIKKLADLVSPAVVEHVIKDHQYDASVFGTTAAAYIEQARRHYQAGNFDQMQQTMSAAKEAAVVTMCGVTVKQSADQKQAVNDAGEKQNKQQETDESSKKKWMNCPHCTARVFDDPCAKVLSCWDCHALVVNGTVVSTGNGGSAKRRQLAKQKYKEVLQKKQATATQAKNEQFAMAA
jgi:hypothetical protein